MMKEQSIAAAFSVATLPARWGQGADGPGAAGGASGTADEVTAAQMQADFDLMRHALDSTRDQWASMNISRLCRPCLLLAIRGWIFGVLFPDPQQRVVQGS